MSEITLDRTRLEEEGTAAAERLVAADVQAIALTFVDNAGVTRVKTVPLERLAKVAAWGVGSSPVADVFCVDDVITTSPHAGGPVGDLRLHPDLTALRILAGQPGWAWAPVDRWRQDGTAYPGDQRGFARRMARRAEEAGLDLLMGFELEWYLAGDGGSPATTPSAYGMTPMVELSDYGRDLLAALAAQGIAVLQFHPEYAAGQLELSVAPTDPVGAADAEVVVRETVRAVSLRHGLRASFAPVPVAGAVGNGMHLHFSVASGGVNLMAGGPGPHGLTDRGESTVAGVLARMPALSGIGAPSVSSHLRLVPQRWAGPYQCWGLENREASLRLIRGVAGSEASAANAEIKCVDGSANPYLVVGAVCSVIVDSVDAGLRLPPEVDVDPATLEPDHQPPRLPESVPEGLAALAADVGLADALGPTLLGAFAAVHQSEFDRFGQRSPAEIAEAVRWRY
jgi:glutamine synthetase